MSRKALLVGLEYPSDPNLSPNPDSIDGILEFSRCLTQQLSFLQSNIEIVVNTSATDRGNKQFDPNQVPFKFINLITQAKQGDALLFLLSGYGLVQPGRQPNIYLGRDKEGKKVFMDAADFDDMLRLYPMPQGVTLNMFIDAHGSSGLLEGLNLDSYPSVVVFTSCERGMVSKSSFCSRWDCSCSHFIYAVIRALETNPGITNLKLAQWVDHVIEERDILLNVARRLRTQNLEEEKQKALEMANVLAPIQCPGLLCTDVLSETQFLSN